MTALPVAFLDRLRALEVSYLRETDPVRQSGFGGGHKRWRTERELVLDAVPDDGDFLDIGCANGYLLECLVGWGQERQVRLTPYGVDCGAQLIALAQERLGGCQVKCVTFSHLHPLSEQDHELIERGFPVANGLGPLFRHML